MITGDLSQFAAHNFFSVLNLKALNYSKIQWLKAQRKILMENDNSVVAVLSNHTLWVHSFVIQKQYCISTLLCYLTVNLFQIYSSNFNMLPGFWVWKVRDSSKLCCCLEKMNSLPINIFITSRDSPHVCLSPISCICSCLSSQNSKLKIS